MNAVNKMLSHSLVPITFTHSVLPTHKYLIIICRRHILRCTSGLDQGDRGRYDRIYGNNSGKAQPIRTKSCREMWTRVGRSPGKFWRSPFSGFLGTLPVTGLSASPNSSRANLIVASDSQMATGVPSCRGVFFRTTYRFRDVSVQSYCADKKYLCTLHNVTYSQPSAYTVVVHLATTTALLVFIVIVSKCCETDLILYTQKAHSHFIFL